MFLTYKYEDYLSREWIFPNFSIVLSESEREPACLKIDRVIIPWPQS